MNVQIGERYFFKNHPKYMDKHPEGFAGGENTLYEGRVEGRQLWSGLGLHRVSELEILEKLAAWYNLPRTEADYRYLVETYVDAAKLDLAGTWESSYQRHKKQIHKDYHEGAFPDVISFQDIIDAGGGIKLSSAWELDPEKIEALKERPLSSP